MNEAVSSRWGIAKSFLINMGIFQILRGIFVLPQGFLLACVWAIVAPFLPPIFAFSEWGSDLHGKNAMQLAALCSAVALSITLSIKYTSNRIFFLAAHVLLFIYWIMCFGIVAIAFT